MALGTLLRPMTAAALAGQRGQDTLEWAGLLALIAMVATGLLVAGVPIAIGHNVSCSVDKILRIGSCSPGDQIRFGVNVPVGGGPGHPAAQMISPSGGWPSPPDLNPGDQGLPFQDGYTYQYTIPGPGGRTTPTDALSYLSQHFGSAFWFASDCPELQVGETCYLKLAEIIPSPVRIIAVGSTSFEFESLPGHLEGPWRYITFSFSSDSSGQLQMSVDAQGPATVGSQATIQSRFAQANWYLFSQKLAHELPG